MKIKEEHPDVLTYSLPPGDKDISDFRKRHGKKATDKLIEEFKQYVNGQTNEKVNSEKDRKTE